MKKLSFLSTFFLLVFAFFSCKNDTQSNASLIGSWQGVQWLRDGAPLYHDPSQVLFTFKEDGTFEGAFANSKEAGTFNLDGDKLYTISEGQLKKMVTIKNLTADTLSFQMNRTGMDEVIVLVRK